jgi:thiamine biosynthesis lipoprotein
LDRLEQELSYFIENSDISRINNLSKNERITVGPDAFDCLKQCMNHYQQTKGAFDITMRPLLELWKKSHEMEQPPTEIQITEIIKKLGLPWLQIFEETHQVQIMTESIKVDLGGFGKGYAIDIMKQHLDDWEIQSGLIHSGYSTVSVFGKKPDSVNWPLSISDPGDVKKIIKKIDLSQGSLSGSGLKKGEHIIDPRSGRPVKNKIAAWAYTTQAGEADALSTAFMVMNSKEITSYCEMYDVSALTIVKDSKYSRKYYGRWAAEAK